VTAIFFFVHPIPAMLLRSPLACPFHLPLSRSLQIVTYVGLQRTKGTKYSLTF
jgi:hypothetical protein